MRLLVSVLAVLVGGSLAQQYYPRAPLRPIVPFRYNRYSPVDTRAVVSHGRITTGASGGSRQQAVVYDRSSGNPCSQSPCGPNTRCDVNSRGVALCRCLEGYVPDGHTINGCKEQCRVDDDCPDDYRCRANNCVRVCVTGACGLNAECDSRNHQAVCRCPSGYGGDAHISCKRQEPDAREVFPPAPYVNPCARQPCGINANCRDEGERPVCSCPYGYEGDPLTNCIRGECTNNDECPGHRVCQKLRCIDPCTLSVCGTNAECTTRDHQPVCSCPRGFVGNPFETCRRFDIRELCDPSPCGRNTNCEIKGDRASCSCITNYIGDPLTECRPECVSDGECPHNMACRNNICINPCVGACGENAYCDVRNGRAICSCPTHYQGDPYSRCYAECTDHDMCSSTKACVELRCVDPCEGACGNGANCKVTNHKAICSCPRTHTGDPFTSCRPFVPADHCNPNPCGTNADCTPGKDREGNDRPVCTCPRFYIGNPLLSCQLGECKENRDCRPNQACYNYECKSPCYTLDGDSVCGEQANCKVENHVPVCSCPSGYVGNPLQSCYIERPGSGSFAQSRYS